MHESADFQLRMVFSFRDLEILLLTLIIQRYNKRNNKFFTFVAQAILKSILHVQSKYSIKCGIEIPWNNNFKNVANFDFFQVTCFWYVINKFWSTLRCTSIIQLISTGFPEMRVFFKFFFTSHTAVYRYTSVQPFLILQDTKRWDLCQCTKLITIKNVSTTKSAKV